MKCDTCSADPNFGARIHAYDVGHGVGHRQTMNLCRDCAAGTAGQRSRVEERSRSATVDELVWASQSATIEELAAGVKRARYAGDDDLAAALGGALATRMLDVLASSSPASEVLT